MSTCANPSCSNPGKLSCSGCGTVSYCGSECQKSHWNEHKAACKAAKKNKKSVQIPIPTPPIVAPSSPSTSPQSPLSEELLTRLQSIKLEAQKSFQSGDFANSIQLGKQALELVSQLPEPGQTIESIQLHINISNANMQLGQKGEAEKHTDLSIEFADRGMKVRPGHPQGIEMMCVALTGKVFNLINNNNLTEAEELAKRSHELAQSIYKPDDPRLYKTNRCLGIINDKLGRGPEAEEFLSKAYRLILAAAGPGHLESHMVLDELIQMQLKRGLIDAAEKNAGQHYMDLTRLIEMRAAFEKKKAENKDKDASPLPALPDLNPLVVGDSAARLASILCRLNRFPEAEPLMGTALSLREKTLGPESQAVGMTLMALADIHDSLGKTGSETESLLNRALDIFKKLEGKPGSPVPNPHVTNCLAHIRRLKARKESGGAVGKGGVTVEDVEDDDGLIVTSESKPRVPGQSPSPNNPTIRPKTLSAKEKEELRKVPIPTMAPNDGVGRMRQAAYYFETQQYSRAEVVISQALEIFMRDFGPEHPSTQNAKQNLEVVRQAGVTHLWQQIAEEELAKLKISDDNESQTSSSPLPSSPVAPEDEWLLKEPTKPSCTIS